MLAREGEQFQCASREDRSPCSLHRFLSPWNQTWRLRLPAGGGAARRPQKTSCRTHGVRQIATTNAIWP
eukprot:1369995-Lingulodinium_polyedra.AAC.1